MPKPQCRYCRPGYNCYTEVTYIAGHGRLNESVWMRTCDDGVLADRREHGYCVICLCVSGAMCSVCLLGFAE